jgi:hypothetical protein
VEKEARRIPETPRSGGVLQNVQPPPLATKGVGTPSP